jgi:hypothetical protein
VKTLDPISSISSSLSEALKEAVAIVEEIDECYRGIALPIILQNLIKETVTVNHSTPSFQSGEQDGSHHSSSQTKIPSRLSVNEFLDMTGIETHIGRFVSVAYYLFHTGQAKTCSQADILSAYTKLRSKKPQNFSDVMGDCIKKAYIIEADSMNGSKCWVITSKGEKYVEDLLNGSASANGKK